MNETRHVSILEATGQLQRLKRAGLIGGFGFVLASSSSYVALRGHMPLATTMFLAGAFLMGVALWVSLRKVVCPKCGDRWLQTAMKTQASGNWLYWLLSIDTCPRCGVTSESIQSGK